MTALLVPQPKSVRPRFTWLLPAWFALACLLGTRWPGHGGQLFCIGALAGVWACLVFESTGDVSQWLLPSILGGVPILALLGLLLDRLQSDLRLWGLLLVGVTAASGYFLLQRFAELDDAVQHHGSLLAFGVCALQLGSYGATIAMLAVGASRTARH